jgi:3-oxoadipate enol-lactonase
LEQAVGGLIESNASAAIVAASRAMKSRPDSSPLLSTLQCPVLIVGSREDALIAETDVESMRAALPDAAAVWIPDAGHLSNLEAPGPFNDALASFLVAIDTGKKTM